jgi:hypothetical protein
MPNATARAGHFVDLVRRIRLPRMDDAIERMVANRLDQCVDVIWHNHMFAEHISLPGEKIQNPFDQPKNFRTAQNACTVAGIEPIMNWLGEVPVILCLLVFVERRLIEGEPKLSFFFQSRPLLLRQRIRQVESDEICDTCLPAVRKIAPINLKIGVRIKEVRHLPTYYIIVSTLVETSLLVPSNTGWKPMLHCASSAEYTCRPRLRAAALGPRIHAPTTQTVQYRPSSRNRM